MSSEVVPNRVPAAKDVKETPMKKARSKPPKKKCVEAKSLELLLGKIRQQARLTVDFYDPLSFKGDCRRMSPLLTEAFCSATRVELSEKDFERAISFFRTWIGATKDTMEVRAFCRRATPRQVLKVARQMINAIESAGEGPFTNESHSPAKKYLEGLWKALSLAGRPQLVKIKDTGWEAPAAKPTPRERKELLKRSDRTLFIVA